ncbi:MAG: response regulator [Gammaproteobacteria bacterium]
MPIRVLIADDHAIVLEGLRATLASTADIHIVAQVRNGLEVVRRAGELRPDVVMMEVVLPELNGIDATQAIRKTCPSSRVVILSIHSGGEYVYRALRAGADGYVVKDAEPAEIAGAIRAVHSGRRYLSGGVTDFIIEDIVSGEEMRSPLEKLSVRERQILQLVVESRTSADVARLLAISVKTVDTYRSRLMGKLGVKDVQGMVKFAIRYGLTSPW